MRFHVISLPHTNTTKGFQTCAYTEKVRKFCVMMHGLGHEVMLYAGEHNEAPCTEHIPCISEDMRLAAVGGRHYTEASFDFGLPHWTHFNHTVILEMLKRVQPRDVICLIAGVANKIVADAFPHMLAVEFGIGYGGSFSKYRVWESYAWMHHCYGFETARAGKNSHAADGQWFDAVIPGYLEPESFPSRATKDDYLLYVGRMTERKGIRVAVEVAKQCGRPLIMAGPGVPPSDSIVDYVGEVGPEDRAKLMGGAHALLAPTIYLEPFGNVAVEAMACGTPVISTDWGAFTETNINGLTGYRCRMFSEFVEAVEQVGELHSGLITAHALANYSLQAVGKKYDAYFRRLDTLWVKGWYTGQT